MDEEKEREERTSSISTDNLKDFLRNPHISEQLCSGVNDVVQEAMLNYEELSRRIKPIFPSVYKNYTSDEACASPSIFGFSTCPQGWVDNCQVFW